MTRPAEAAPAISMTPNGGGPYYSRQYAVNQITGILWGEYRRWFRIVSQISALDGAHISRDNRREIAERLTRKADDIMRHIAGIKAAAHAIGITDAMLDAVMGPLAEELQQREMEVSVG